MNAPRKTLLGCLDCIFLYDVQENWRSLRNMIVNFVLNIMWKVISCAIKIFLHAESM